MGAEVQNAHSDESKTPAAVRAAARGLLSAQTHPALDTDFAMTMLCLAASHQARDPNFPGLCKIENNNKHNNYFQSYDDS